MNKAPLFAATLIISACSNYQVPDSPRFPANSTWAIMPMENNSSTPLAGEKAEQLLSVQLYAKGITAIRYPSTSTGDLLTILNHAAKQKQAEKWLAAHPVDYIITGSVEEWQYKSGLDGEPAVGLTLEVKSAKNDQTYWQASGSRSGWGRESISSTGQIVLENILDGLIITPPAKQ